MRVSGYTTTYNCIEADFPFRECLAALEAFCDEICVADAGSTDGTMEAIRREFAAVRVEAHPVDFDHPRWAIHADGYLKTRARLMCSGDVLWQTDMDEVVHPDEYALARRACETALEERRLLALPVLEFWGNLDALRGDVGYKPRVSPNDPAIIHGIPWAARQLDGDRHEYPRPFVSDSCDYLSAGLRLPIPIHAGPGGPSLWHTSWLSLERKIRHYQRFWHRYNRSMYNLPLEDTAANNVMFDKPWTEVTEKDVRDLARELALTGPRVFHTKAPFWRGATRPRAAHERVPPSLARWHAARGLA